MTEIETQKMLDACPPEIMQKILHNLDLEQERYCKLLDGLTLQEKQEVLDDVKLEQKNLEVRYRQSQWQNKVEDFETTLKRCLKKWKNRKVQK